MIKIELKTTRRSELVEITELVARGLASPPFSGLCLVYVPHTTAGVTINENADPSVRLDIEYFLDRLVPRGGSWRHLEGNSDSHVKASLVGSSVLVAVEKGRVNLGTWQGIFFCEFDGPRHREVWLGPLTGETAKA